MYGVMEEDPVASVTMPRGGHRHRGEIVVVGQLAVGYVIVLNQDEQ